MIRFRPLLAACFRTSMVAMAVVAMPFTATSGSPARKLSALLGGGAPAADCRLVTMSRALGAAPCAPRTPAAKPAAVTAKALLENPDFVSDAIGAFLIRLIKDNSVTSWPFYASRPSEVLPYQK